MSNSETNTDRTARHVASSDPSQPPIRRVGIVGLGHMGHAFAANLVDDGYQVLAFDQDAQRAAELPGAHAAAQLSDLGGCDAVLTSLPNDAALAEVALSPGGLVQVLQPGAIHISTSTVSMAMSRRVEAEHVRHAQGYVAAPVLGNPESARARMVFVVAAGARRPVARVSSLLTRLGQRLFIVGEHGEIANLMKLGANVLTATTLECLGEVLALLQKGGLDRHLAFDVLTNSLFDSRVHKSYGSKMVEDHYSPADFPVPLATKDLRLALAEAERNAVPMPAAGLVHDRLVALAARGWGELDWSALGLLAAVEAGISDSPPHGRDADQPVATAAH